MSKDEKSIEGRLPFFKNPSIGIDNYLNDNIKNIIVHQSQTQAPASKLPESWNVPRRNSKFTGREKQLTEIGAALSRPDVQIIACVGLGGVGKTNLVLEYLHRNLKKYEGGIAWFCCENRKVISEQINRLGTELDLQEIKKIEKENEGSHINEWKKMKTWLEDNRQSGWLLVLDDVNDVEDVLDMFPERGGKIIITSRYQVWDNTIVVGTFERFESIEYLKKTCPERANEVEWNELANYLSDLPLALDQASVYLNENVTISAAKFLKMYKTRIKSLLSAETLEKYIKVPVYFTWDKTMKEVEKHSQFALQLLRALSLFSSKNIPNEIFDNFEEIFYPSKNICTNELFEILHTYSLIESNKQTNLSSMHSLFQEVVRLRIIEEQDVTLLESTLILFNLWCKKRKLSYMNETELLQLVPHVESLYKYSVHFLNCIPGNKEDLIRFSKHTNELWFLLEEIYYYPENFKKPLDVKSEHIEFKMEFNNNIIFLLENEETLNSTIDEKKLPTFLDNINKKRKNDLKALKNIENHYQNEISTSKTPCNNISLSNHFNKKVELEGKMGYTKRMAIPGSSSTFYENKLLKNTLKSKHYDEMNWKS